MDGNLKSTALTAHIVVTAPRFFEKLMVDDDVIISTISLRFDDIESVRPLRPSSNFNE